MARIGDFVTRQLVAAQEINDILTDLGVTKEVEFPKKYLHQEHRFAVIFESIRDALLTIPRQTELAPIVEAFDYGQLSANTLKALAGELELDVRRADGSGNPLKEDYARAVNAFFNEGQEPVSPEEAEEAVETEETDETDETDEPEEVEPESE